MVDLDQQIRKLKRLHITDNGRICIMNNDYVMKYICLGFVVQSKPHNEKQMAQGHFTAYNNNPHLGRSLAGLASNRLDTDIFYFSDERELK